MTTRDKPEHGTIAAFEQHVLAKEKPCDPCRVFRREYQRMWAAGLTKRRICPNCLGGMNHQSMDLCSKCSRRAGKKPACGTVRGYLWHTMTLHEEPCEACNDARNLQRSGYKPKPCLTDGCGRLVKVKGSLHCALCKRQPIVDWTQHKGIRIPVYLLKGAYRAKKAG